MCDLDLDLCRLKKVRCWEMSMFNCHTRVAFVLLIPFHTQAKGRAVICQSKRCVGLASDECAWWRFNSFLVGMTVEIPRKAAWSYLIRPACVESTTSIRQSLCENDEDCRPQPSLQGAMPVARQLTWLVGRGNIAEHRAIIHSASVYVSIPDVPRKGG